jgi:hypothetical protein
MIGNLFGFVCRVFLVGAFLFAIGACSSSNGETDQDGGCCSDDGLVTLDDDLDGGEVAEDQGADEGPTACEHDRECPPDKVCDLATGECVAGTACNYDYNCNPDYCHPEGQVCKTRSQLCEPCSEHYECPDPLEGDMCVLYLDGKKYCGQRCGKQECPTGYVCDESVGSGDGENPGQCVSNTSVCGEVFICQNDDQCEGNFVCDKSLGICVPGCVTDNNCSGTQKCHMSGHCGPICQTDNDCDEYNPDFICCLPDSGGFCTSEHIGRCRPLGCYLHSECLQSSGDSFGYCDNRTGDCMPGCRWWDSTTINDCRPGYKCECSTTISCDQIDCCPDPDSDSDCLCDPKIQSCADVEVCDNGQCVEIPCQEYGAIDIACGRNQLCCGWPQDGYSCVSDVPQGECYVAPKETWCASCPEANKECPSPDGYGYGEKAICLEDSGDQNTYCHLGCRDDQDCPSKWKCDYSFMQGCETDEHCTNGATCQVIARQYDDSDPPEVVEMMACVCSGDSQCASDMEGFAGTCLSESFCDKTVDPYECQDFNICLFAKACQCSNCCSQL